MLTVVVPCYNEELVIAETNSRLITELEKLEMDFEIIYVNDGSTDSTLEGLRSIRSQFSQVKIINLSRNFGHQIAVTAGLDRASGDAVVIIDADLQDPPHVIAAMVARWKEGFEVVYGTRIERGGETRFKLLSAALFYKLLNKLSDVNIPQNVGDFRLIDRKVLNALKAMPERDRFLRGMVSWTGFEQCSLEYRRDARFAGETKYPLKRMLSLAFDAILSFSTVPLRAAIWVGIAVAGLASIGIIYAVVLRLFTNKWVPGWTLLLVSVFFLGGIELVFMGVIGEYIGRIFTEVKNRPLYFVAHSIGFDDEPD